MKSLLTSFVAAASLFVASQAYIVELYENNDCTGDSTSLNVWDSTCAYTSGFQSLKLTYNGGYNQQLIAYSPQACAGPETLIGCAYGVNSLPLDVCYLTINDDGGSNALSSYLGGNCN